MYHMSIMRIRTIMDKDGKISVEKGVEVTDAGDSDEEDDEEAEEDPEKRDQDAERAEMRPVAQIPPDTEADTDRMSSRALGKRAAKSSAKTQEAAGPPPRASKRRAR